MKVLCVGGGSGGHVTPVLAVLSELSQLDHELEARFVCDRAFEPQSRGLMKHAPVSVPVSVISAGKLRRYHGIPLWKQLLDIPTMAKNIRDVALIGAGFLQSLRLLRGFRPDVVFAKGGYVCLPLGYAAKLLKIPLVIHDSDTRPGLTNSLLSGFASAIATGSPLENYSYPKDRSVYTGVPIDPAFHPYTAKEQRDAKQAIGIIDLNKPLIVVTGGGLGAESINTGVVATAADLLADNYSIYHVTGKKQYDHVKAVAPEHADYHLVPFVYKDMPTVLGAADIVISRGSATFLQELAALAKPTIIVAAAHLGDQVKNAQVFQAAEAAVVLDDMAIRDGALLRRSVQHLHDYPDETAAMAERFHTFARQDAARDVAQMIIKTGLQGRGH